jgi:hypothetical protein
MTEKTFLGNEINFNQPPVMWAGMEVYPGNGATSNLYGTLNVVKNPEETITPDINTDGNVNVKKDVNVEKNINVDEDINIGGTAYGDFQGTINVQSWKGFDISHPTKENHRLRYVCLEGPEGGVYFRGRIANKTEIELPDYWKDLVDIESITVSLTPIGSYQNVIVKNWDENKIYLESNKNMIDCFYHIFAERKDGEKLIVEYEGQSPADYPGDSSQYSIAGYDYGRTP